MLGSHRQTNQSAAILRHEVNGLRCDLLSSDGQITFVFAIFVVNNDPHLARVYGRNSILNAREWARAPVELPNNLKPSLHISALTLIVWSEVAFRISFEDLRMPRPDTGRTLKPRRQVVSLFIFRACGTPKRWSANSMSAEASTSRIQNT